MRSIFIILIILLATGLNSFAQNVALEDGLLIYFPFTKCNDDTIIDFSGNGHHGIPMNGGQYTTDVRNQTNCAYEFDGVNDYIYVKDFGLHYPEREATVSFWAKANVFKSANVYWLDTRSQTNRISGEVMYSHNGVNVCFMDHGNINNGRLRYDYSFDTDWHHYVFVHSRAGNYMELFVDGQSVERRNSSATYSQTAVDLWIGGIFFNNQPMLFFNGKVDEFRVYDRILNNDEIDELSDIQKVNCPSCPEIEIGQGGVDSLQICQGDSIQLNGKTSSDNSYSWTPQTNLINFSSNQPTAFPSSNQLYVVTYRNEDNQIVNDSFFVEVIDTVSHMVFNDTLLCTGGTMEIDISNVYSVEWSDGSMLNRRSLNQAGSYALEVRNSICLKNFNFEINTQENPIINIDGDLIVCEGESTEVSVTTTPNDLNFTWVNEGFENIKNRTLEPGFYKVTGSNECGDASDSILIEEFIFDEINYDGIYDYCIGDTVRIDFSNFNQHTIEWNDGNTDFVREFTERGSYNFTISENNCKLEGAFDFFFFSPPYLNIDTNYSLCNGVETTITPIDYSGRILWDNQFTRENFVVLNRTTPLPVRIENNCGVDSLVINFDLKDCNCYIFLPNTFTPNNDGTNDVFRPIVNCDKLVSYQLTIFNQWGEKIYQTIDPLHSWDGKYKRKLVETGIYFYTVDYIGDVNNVLKRTNFSGTIHVMY